MKHTDRPRVQRSGLHTSNGLADVPRQRRKQQRPNSAPARSRGGASPPPPPSTRKQLKPRPAPRRLEAEDDDGPEFLTLAQVSASFSAYDNDDFLARLQRAEASDLQRQSLSGGSARQNVAQRHHSREAQRAEAQAAFPPSMPPSRRLPSNRPQRVVAPPPRPRFSPPGSQGTTTPPPHASPQPSPKGERSRMPPVPTGWPPDRHPSPPPYMATASSGAVIGGAPPLVSRTPSEIWRRRMIAGFKQSRSRSAVRLGGGGGGGGGGGAAREHSREHAYEQQQPHHHPFHHEHSSSPPPPLVRVRSTGQLAQRGWMLARKFVTWFGSERRKQRQEAKAAQAEEMRRAEKRQRQARASHRLTERREAEERRKLDDAERQRRARRLADRAEAEAVIAHALNEEPKRIEDALDAAAALQATRAAAAAALPATVQAERPGGDLWTKFGGPAVEEMLSDIELIDARYLIDLAEMGGVVPRCQDVPSSAKINTSNAWRLRFSWHEYDCLAVLVLS